MVTTWDVAKKGRRIGWVKGAVRLIVGGGAQT